MSKKRLIISFVISIVLAIMLLKAFTPGDADAQTFEEMRQNGTLLAFFSCFVFVAFYLICVGIALGAGGSGKKSQKKKLILYYQKKMRL